MRKWRSIRSTLLLAYSIIITFTFVVLGSFFVAWGTSRLRDAARERLSGLADSIMLTLDDEVRKLDDVSLAVLYSNLVTERSTRYLDSRGQSAAASPAISDRQGDLIDVFLAIIGPSMSVRQINIYDLQGAGFGVGMDNRPRTVDISATPWFAQAIKAGGTLVLTAPHEDAKLARYGSASPTASTERFISLCRLLFNRYNIPIGVVEVEQSCDQLFTRLAPAARAGDVAERLIVFNTEGQRLFPTPPDEAPDADYYRALLSGPGETGAAFVRARNPVTGRPELVAFRASEYSGWRAAVVSDERTLLAPLSSFLRTSILLAIAVLSAALFFSFIAARRITRPIARMHTALTTLDLESLGEGTAESLGSGLNELESLNRAFQGMRTKLRTSIDEHIASHRREMQARMLALQSQMNPHFLYNTLATISVLAEEGHADRAVALCANVAGMLRYLSSQKSTFVEARAELDHTALYLQCMAVRHGTKLVHTFSTDPAFASLRIPKLVVQPLVENAVKFGTRGDPPWTIGITARITDGAWRVRVEDDGPGFSEPALARVSALAADPYREEFHGLELDGMGLANIAIRLRIAYGAAGYFACGNRSPGGAFVEIGGTVQFAEEVSDDAAKGV